MLPRLKFELEVGRRRTRLGERTLVMGVLNVTPDSFSDGGVYLNPDRAIEHGLEMDAQGADWIDVGGESTRPGSKPIPAEEELGRVLPVIRGLSSKLRKLRRPAAISVDTTKAEVAEQAILAGAGIINGEPHSKVAQTSQRVLITLVLLHPHMFRQLDDHPLARGALQERPELV